MGVNVFPAGSLVRVTSYGPFRGLKGTIRAITLLSTEPDEPCCYYLVALQGALFEDPIWFEYDEIEIISAPLIASQIHK